MTLKAKMSLLVFLTSLSIVSIGFSSWSITVESQAEIGGKIEVDNVIDVKDCIYLNINNGDDNTGITNLKFSTSGFFNDKNQINTQGFTTVFYELDLKNCNSIFSPLATLDFSFSMTYSDNTTKCKLIDSYLKKTNTEIKVNNNVISNTYSYANNEYKVSFSLNDILSSYNPEDDSYANRYRTISITYYFEHQIGDTFKTNIYDYFEGTGLKLNVRSTLTAR